MEVVMAVARETASSFPLTDGITVACSFYWDRFSARLSGQALLMKFFALGIPPISERKFPMLGHQQGCAEGSL